MTHLRVFLKARQLDKLLPKIGDLDFYQEFAEKENISFSFKAPKNAPEAEDEDGQEALEIEDYEEVGNVNFPYELVLMAQQSNSHLPSLLRWIRTFIVHFLAKRALQTFVLNSPGEEISFTVIDVNCSQCMETPTWSDLEDVIKRTIPSVETSSKLIAQLKTWIIMEPTGNDAKGKLVQTFQDIISGIPTSIPATLHCEMVTAMLGSRECYDMAIKNKDFKLQKLCEVWQFPFQQCYTDYYMTPGNSRAGFIEIEIRFSVNALLSRLLGVFQSIEGAKCGTHTSRKPS